MCYTLHMRTDQPIIKVDGLTKTFRVKQKHGFLKDLFRPEFRHVHAVKDLSFEVRKGESVAFLGPNGAGKTTTTKMLSGLIYPSAGEISVMGYFPFDRKRDFLMQIGLVMGNKAGLNWDLTPEQSFELYKEIYKINDDDFKQRIETMTELLHTKKYLKTQVRKLSLGERMKMELIAALLHAPKVLFLDEPTIGLDIISKHKIRKFLRTIQEESDVTLLLTSHDMDDVEMVCDRVIVINEGEKVYDDMLENLMRQYKQDRYVKFVFHSLPPVADFNKLLAPLQSSVVKSDESSHLVKCSSERMPDVIAKVTQDFKVADIDIVQIPLEKMIADIFKESHRPPV